LRKNSKETETESACNGSFEVYPGIIAFVEWTIRERNMEQSLPERHEHRIRYPDLQSALHQMSVACKKRHCNNNFISVPDFVSISSFSCFVGFARRLLLA
jgi:hypothetical protein